MPLNTCSCPGWTPLGIWGIMIAQLDKTCRKKKSCQKQLYGNDRKQLRRLKYRKRIYERNLCNAWAICTQLILYNRIYICTPRFIRDTLSSKYNSHLRAYMILPRYMANYIREYICYNTTPKLILIIPTQSFFNIFATTPIWTLSSYGFHYICLYLVETTVSRIKF